MLSVRGKLPEENQTWNRIANDTQAVTLDVLLRKGCLQAETQKK